MKTLVITGGECPSAPILRHLAESADLIIAADSGFDASRAAGIVPDLIVGDFDSINDRASLSLYEKEHILQYPIDKDATDTEIALAQAYQKGAGKIVLAGGGGGRLDHLIGLISILGREQHPDEWHTSAESIYRLEGYEKGYFKVGKGEIVSVFPLRQASEFMSSEGLKWPLDGLVWTAGEFGISNVAIAERIRIRAGNTALIVVLPLGSQRLA
ncbi:MAG: thiamine diphosphokinase [Spirochaetes bacterium]|nr:thiamine diphosphokinase [Spirochaetota bacterium]